MNARFNERMEALKIIIIENLNNGTFADLPTDEYGITPETRMWWGVNSIDYIIGISNSLQQNFDIKNQMMLATCYDIKNLSGDPYVEEGIFNIRWVLTILAIFNTDYSSEDDVMNTDYYQTIRKIILKRKVDENENRYRKANREAIRLTMLLNRVGDWIEQNERSAGNR